MYVYEIRNREGKIMPIAAIDFDGTLCENAYPKIGAPKWEVINKVKILKKDGWQLILWTCREEDNLVSAIDWCKSVGLEFDAVNDEVPEIKELFASGSMYRTILLREATRCGAKIYADIYLDDKNVTLEEFLRD
jgi:hypothetical protein